MRGDGEDRDLDLGGVRLWLGDEADAEGEGGAATGTRRGGEGGVLKMRLGSEGARLGEVNGSGEAPVSREGAGAEGSGSAGAGTWLGRAAAA